MRRWRARGLSIHHDDDDESSCSDPDREVSQQSDGHAQLGSGEFKARCRNMFGAGGVLRSQAVGLEELWRNMLGLSACEQVSQSASHLVGWRCERRTMVAQTVLWRREGREACTQFSGKGLRNSKGNVPLLLEWVVGNTSMRSKVSGWMQARASWAPSILTGR